MLQIKNDWQQSGWTCDFSADCSLLQHKLDNWSYREFHHGFGNIQIDVSVIQVNFTLPELEHFACLAIFWLDCAVSRTCSINLDIFHTDINILHSVTDFHWLFALAWVIRKTHQWYSTDPFIYQYGRLVEKMNRWSSFKHIISIYKLNKTAYFITHHWFDVSVQTTQAQCFWVLFVPLIGCNLGGPLHLSLGVDRFLAVKHPMR